MMTNRKTIIGMIGMIATLATALVAFMSGPAMATAKSHEYGNVVIDRAAKKNQGQPVVFRHWSHRAKYSCRLCHVDLEFSMQLNETGITEDDNKNGRYCGTCHNGKDAFAISECTKCHAKDAGAAEKLEADAKQAFLAISKGLPRSPYGNKVDWNKAEEENKISAKDFIAGVSFPAKDLVKNSRNEPRNPTLPGLPGIIFSHSKHVAWTGCGMCHPEPYALESGKTKMSMKEITDGKFCGVCHGKVAFPLSDCSNCHSKPVAQ